MTTSYVSHMAAEANGNTRKFGYRNNHNLPVGPVRIRVGSGAGGFPPASDPDPRPTKTRVCVTTVLIVILLFALALAPTGGAITATVKQTIPTTTETVDSASHTTIEDAYKPNIEDASVAILADVALPVSQAPKRKSSAWFLPARVQSWSTDQDTRRASPGDPRFEDLRKSPPLERDHLIGGRSLIWLQGAVDPMTVPPVERYQPERWLGKDSQDLTIQGERHGVEMEAGPNWPGLPRTRTAQNFSGRSRFYAEHRPFALAPHTELTLLGSSEKSGEHSIFHGSEHTVSLSSPTIVQPTKPCPKFQLNTSTGTSGNTTG